METKNKGNMYFFIIMMSMLLGSIFIGIVIAVTKVNLGNMEIMLITQYGFILLPTLIIAASKGKFKERIKIKKIGFDDVIIILGISLLAFIMTTMINIISTRVFHNFLGDAVATFPKMGLLQWLFVLAVTPAINEEVIMRGLVLSEFKHVSYFKAAMINGFLFGIFHLNINQFLYAFVLGAIMAYMVIITKSILSSMLMHFSINGVAAFSQWSVSNSKIDVASQQAEAQEVLNSNTTLIVCCIGVVVFIAIIAVIIKWWAGRNGIRAFDRSDRLNNENKVRIFDGWIVASIIVFLAYTAMNYLASGLI